MLVQTKGVKYASLQYVFHRLSTNWTVAYAFHVFQKATMMLRTNEMLLALLVGCNAALVSAETPAMPVEKANEYLSTGKNCVR